MEKLECRAVIKYLFLKGNTPTQIKDELDDLYGDSAPSFTTVKFWAAEFKRGRTSLGDDERAGLPKTATTDDNVAKVHQMVLNDRRIKVKEVTIEKEIEDGVNMGESKNASRKQIHEVYIKVEDEDHFRCIDADDDPKETIQQNPLHSLSQQSTKEVEVNQLGELDLSESGVWASSWSTDGIGINYMEYHESEIMHYADKPEIKIEPEEGDKWLEKECINKGDGVRMGKIRRKNLEKKDIDPEELRKINGEESRVLFKAEATVEQDLICHNCGEKRNTKRELRDHIYVAHLSVSMIKEKEEDVNEYKRNRLKCTFCQKSFESKNHLVRHLNIHTGKEQRKFNDFKESSPLSTNLTSDVFKDASKKLFKCGSCEYRASRKCYLKIHESIHSGNKPYKCNDCKYSTADMSCLTRHIRIHTGEKPFKCNLCEYSSALRKSLNLHIKKHTNQKPFKCHLCEYSTALKSSLNLHIRIHTNEKPFKCNICEYATSRKSCLKVHESMHSGEKPYKCNFCKYSTADRSSLTRHIRIHTGEKPFKCNLCEYSTALKLSLNLHIKIHTNDKPFKCDMCEYRTSRKSCLKVHESTHSGEKPYKCNDCKYSTANRSCLTRHIRIHSGEKPFKCNKCEYSSSRKSSLKVHLQRHSCIKPLI